MNNGVWATENGIELKFSEEGVFLPLSFFALTDEEQRQQFFTKASHAYFCWFMHQTFREWADQLATEPLETIFERIKNCSDEDFAFWCVAWVYSDEWQEEQTDSMKRLERAVARAAAWRDVPNHTKGGFVYLLKSVSGYYKIGRTKSPSDRIRTFGIKLPFEVEYECVLPAKDMYELETKLHEHFAEKRVNGEWFNLTPEDVAIIKGMEI